MTYIILRGMVIIKVSVWSGKVSVRAGPYVSGAPLPKGVPLKFCTSEIFDNFMNSIFIETFEFGIETKFFKCYLPGNENGTYYLKRPNA